MSGKQTYAKASSKIKQIYIPLPGFDFFHKPSNINKEDPHFVGRERSGKVLKNYLKSGTGKEQNISGSYLITGYRGIGKSSFVGKVIKELIDEQWWTKIVKNKPIVRLLLLLGSIIAFYPFLFIFLYIGCESIFSFLKYI